MKKRKKKPASLASKIISWTFFTILLVIGAILIVYVVNLKIAQANGTVNNIKYSAYTIISGSMDPKIKVYDVVVDQKVSASDLEVGDVITFISSDPYLKGTTITHRIIEIKNSGGKRLFKTKGDANQFADNSLALEENIIGRVLFVIPQLGRLQFFIASRGGWLIVVLIPAFIIIGYDVVKLMRILRTQKDKTNNKENKDEITKKILQNKKETIDKKVDDENKISSKEIINKKVEPIKVEKKVELPKVQETKEIINKSKIEVQKEIINEEPVIIKQEYTNCDTSLIKNIYDGIDNNQKINIEVEANKEENNKYYYDGGLTSTNLNFRLNNYNDHIENESKEINSTEYKDHLYEEKNNDDEDDDLDKPKFINILDEEINYDTRYDLDLNKTNFDKKVEENYQKLDDYINQKYDSNDETTELDNYIDKNIND